jgi:hypothetical protein
MLEVSTRRCEIEGQVEFKVTAVIAAPADRIYALIDWADEQNAKRQLGDSVIALDDEGRRFRLVVRFMSDLEFDYEVLEAVKPSIYACLCLPTPSIGHLESTVERYEIGPGEAQGSTVTLMTLAQYARGLSEAQMDEVTRRSTVACHNALAKLKAFAEYGVGTIEAFENTVLMPAV